MNFRKLPFYNEAVKPYLFAKNFHAASKNNYPASAMKVIGITGTNGKTTTTWMVFNVLREKFGDKVGVMSTIGWGNGNEIKAQTAHATTEDAGVLQKHLAELRDKGVEYVVLEVSSHALAQRRIFGIPIDTAIFTNLSPDHLDYHKTMEKYSAAKQRLFSLAEKKRNGKKLGIVNFDDNEFANFAGKTSDAVSYSLANPDADLFAEKVKLTPSGVEYDLKMNANFVEELAEQNENFAKKYASAKAKAASLAKFHIKTQIPGEFNVYNSLAATAVGLKYGLSRKEIEAGIAKTRVAGRMNSVNAGQKFSVIIDFATTPDAFENVLPGIRETTKGRVISLFGLPGARDQTKAAGMGKIGAKYSDILIFTEDDARGNVRAQSEKMAAGVPKDFAKKGGEVKYIDDRKKAIEEAMKIAKAGDTVVLLGKGPEKIIARMKNGKVVDEPWDEEKTARNAIEKSLVSSKKTVAKSKKISKK